MTAVMPLGFGKDGKDEDVILLDICLARWQNSTKKTRVGKILTLLMK